MVEWVGAAAVAEEKENVMRAKRPIVALCYDFDGTLAPGNMQEYGFFSGLGDIAKTFWREATALAQENAADPILCYMMLMIQKARLGKIKTTHEALRAYGRDVRFFPGVEDWFARIRAFGHQEGVEVEHYIVSSGLRELIEGSAIGKAFKKIYACSFLYDNNDCAMWPANVVNYTTKTQYLFRINKGVEDDADNLAVNAFVPEAERRIPFSRIIYLGDGLTDVPCMRLVRLQGGIAIAVYPKGRAQTAKRLLTEDRVNYAMEANYAAGGKLERLVQAAIGRIALTHRMTTLAGQNHRHHLPNQ